MLHIVLILQFIVLYVNYFGYRVIMNRSRIAAQVRRLPGFVEARGEIAEAFTEARCRIHRLN